MKTTRELQPRERACANDHHNLLLDNLALACKFLIYRCNLSRNQKQKFHLVENENIELSFVNVENKGKFPILIFVQLYKVT